MTADTALTTPDCLLTLAVPAALEEDVLDLLRTLPHMAPGFTLVPAQGMGAHIHLASTALVQLGKVQEIVYGDMSGLNGISPRAYGGGYDSAPMMSVAKADIEPQDVQVRESVIMVFELLD